jgi:hypothetical protein
MSLPCLQRGHVSWSIEGGFEGFGDFGALGVFGDFDFHDGALLGALGGVCNGGGTTLDPGVPRIASITSQT